MRQIVSEPAFHTDPTDYADRMRSAAHLFMADASYEGELLEALEAGAAQLDRSVPIFWLYVCLVEAIAMFGMAFWYTLPGTCG